MSPHSIKDLKFKLYAFLVELKNWHRKRISFDKLINIHKIKKQRKSITQKKNNIDIRRTIILKHT